MWVGVAIDHRVERVAQVSKDLGVAGLNKKCVDPGITFKIATNTEWTILNVGVGIFAAIESVRASTALECVVSDLTKSRDLKNRIGRLECRINKVVALPQPGSDTKSVRCASARIKT